MSPILIIEDDKEIREALSSFLEIEGYAVVAAEDGRKGLEIVQNHSGPSLILLDLFMPQMGGLEFLKRYSELNSEVPVVICSACPPDHTTFVEAKALAQHALTKPIDIDQVLALARRYYH